MAATSGAVTIDRGAAGNYAVAISGGTILVTASGDGIDANGALSMSGGTLVIQGPTANNNGALDYDRSFELTGGLLVAAGSAGMAQGPGTGSTQASLHVRFASVQAAGSIVSIKPAGGEEVVTVRVAKAFQSLVVSSPKLVAPQVYDVYTGGSATGSELNGLFTGGSHSGGTKTGTATAALVIPRTGR